MFLVMMMMMLMMMMMTMMMIMTQMKLVNSATKFRHGMDRFYQPNSGLRGSRSLDEATYTYIIIIIIILLLVLLLLFQLILCHITVKCIMFHCQYIRVCVCARVRIVYINSI